MRETQELETTRFDELMARQLKLCDREKAKLSGNLGMAAELEDARRDYTRQLRLNAWDLIQESGGDPEATFQSVGAFLSKRMTEIVGSITGLSDEDEDYSNIIVTCCESDYAELINVQSGEGIDSGSAVTVIVNDAVDVAVPAALHKAHAQVRQSLLPQPDFQAA